MWLLLLPFALALPADLPYAELESLNRAGNLPRLLERSGQVLAEARSQADSPLLALALNWRAIALMQSGDVDTPRLLLGESLGISRRTGHRQLEAFTLVDLARLDNYRGRYCEGEKHMVEAMALTPLLQAPDPMLTLANAQIGCGHLDAALETIDRALAKIPTKEPASVRAPFYSVAATIERKRGHDERAIALLRQAIEAMETGLGLEHADLIYPLVELGGIERRAHQLAKAKATMDRAARIVERNGLAANPNLWPMYEEYAIVLRANKEKKQAAIAEKHARELKAAAGPVIRDHMVSVSALQKER